MEANASAPVGALGALACFAACCATPAAYLRARAWAQDSALRLVHAGVPVVLAVQRVESRLLTLVFDATAFSVSVPFYGASLPLLAWVGEVTLVRNLAMLMTLVMWLGNTTKDTFCLPRPRALSKAVRVMAHSSDQKQNAEEYGLPSTHVANCLAFFCWALVHAEAHTEPRALAALAAWTALVALGRLYLGMHTPVDLVAGAAVGGAALAIWWQLRAPWDAWVLAAGAWRVAAAHGAGCVLLACCYPRPPVFTPSFNFVTFFSGVQAGIAVGVARTAGLGIHEAPGLLRLTLTPAGAATLLGRVAVGTPVMLAARVAFRAAARLTWPAAHAVFSALRALSSAAPALPRPKSPRCVDAPPQRAVYDGAYLWTRFWSYAGVGWGLMEPCMLALRFCGLL